MQADDWHTDAAGYDLIARAVADAIVKNRLAADTKLARSTTAR